MNPEIKSQLDTRIRTIRYQILDIYLSCMDHLLNKTSSTYLVDKIRTKLDESKIELDELEKLK